MGEKIIRYKYKVNANLVFDNSEEINIPAESIIMILLDYDYLNKTMPIIYMTLNIESSIYTKLVLTTDTSRIMLHISRYDQDSNVSASKVIFKHLFYYFLSSSDTNYTKDIDNTSNQLDRAYKRITIGLLNPILIDQNRKSFNGIYKNINNNTLIHLAISHIPKVIMESPDNTNQIDTIIIPPIDNVSEYIRFINRYSLIYKNSNYIFFMDFDKTYLLSTRGNTIDNEQISTYNNININIKSTITEEANSVGIVICDDKSSYIIYVDAINTNLNIDKGNDKLFNHIIASTSIGTIIEADIYTVSGNNKYNKNTFVRLPYSNTDFINCIIDDYESDIILSITKEEMDISIFTPDKKYTVNNFDDNKKYNGQYILLYKKDILILDNGHFNSSTTIGLKKIM